jgi:WD40 repeat protein
VRCVDTFKDLMVTGGSDLTLNIYTRHSSGKYQPINKLDIFESYIYSVRINPFDQSTHAIAVGCKDSKIFIFDAVGNPTGILEGHQSAVSSLSWLDKNTLVSGSWDATANVWAVQESKALLSLKGHSHAVCVLAVGDMNRIITGSQDGNLNLWEANTGKLVKRKEKAHMDIIR